MLMRQWSDNGDVVLEDGSHEVVLSFGSLPEVITTLTKLCRDYATAQVALISQVTLRLDAQRRVHVRQVSSGHEVVLDHDELLAAIDHIRSFNYLFTMALS